MTNMSPATNQHSGVSFSTFRARPTVCVSVILFMGASVFILLFFCIILLLAESVLRDYLILKLQHSGGK